MIRNFVLLVLLSLLGAGCTLAPPLPAHSDWQARQEQLEALSRWDLSGRISVRTPAEAANGSLTWTQDGQHTDLGFRGPLGIGGFRLRGDDRQMLFEDSKGGQFVINDPGAALADQLGWEVPLNSLRYWVRALPDPGMQAEQFFEPSGRLARLQQDGWSVDYENYVLKGVLAMPGRVTIERKDIRIRLIIDHWDLDSSP